MDPKVNQLIAALPEQIFQQWVELLEAVDMPSGLVLHEPGLECCHVYFPTTSIVSLSCRQKDGSSTEVAVVGREGAVGISLVMGRNTSMSRAVVQSAGRGFRLPKAAVADLVEEGGLVTHLLLRYSQALITQMALTAVCNRHHRVDQRLSRRLLLILDRLATGDLTMNHEFDSHLPGVDSASVTQAAQALESAGLISYARGHIGVVDRPGLERHCCDCYSVVKREYERLLAGTAAT